MDGTNPDEVIEAPKVESGDAPTIKRGRGRPRKDAAATPINPDAAAEEKPNRRRSKKSFDRELFAKQIMGAHFAAATFLSAPEMIIQSDEALALADSMANMAACYEIQISEKASALLTLAGTMAMIYVPRIIAIKSRVRSDAAKDVTPSDNEFTA
jgi:hypothetical protein